jgi:Bacterial archaeo-eukaryotic release factor family 7
MLTSNDLKALAKPLDGPAISILLPTELAGPQTRQSPIRFQNLLTKARSLMNGSGNQDAIAERISEQCEPLIADYDYWQHRTPGLAVFCSEQGCQLIDLPYEPPEVVSLGNRYHLKPLLPMPPRSGPFYVLALSGNLCRLYEAKSSDWQQVQVEDLPDSLADALGLDEPQQALQFHTGAPRAKSGRAAVFHGQGGGEDAGIQFQQYARACQAAVSRHLKGQDLPLILATADEHVPIYRQVNTYPGLVEDTWIAGNPDHVPADELRSRGRAIVESLAEKDEQGQLDRLQERIGSEKASTDLAEIFRASVQGRIETTFVAADQEHPGVADQTTGKIELTSDGPDLLNELVAQTLLQGGDAFSVPAEKLPTDSGVAAIFRY